MSNILGLLTCFQFFNVNGQETSGRRIRGRRRHKEAASATAVEDGGMVGGLQTLWPYKTSVCLEYQVPTYFEKGNQLCLVAKKAI